MCSPHEIQVLKTTHNIPSLDDLVFKDRNKAYGSYVLRKSYNRRIFFSFIYALCILLVLFIYSFRDLIFPGIYPTKPADYHVADADVYSKYFTMPQGKKQSEATYASSFVVPEIVNNKQEVVPQENIKQKDSGTSDSTGVSSSESSAGGTRNSDNSSLNGDGVVYGSADVNPQFPGGPKAMQEFIMAAIKYPEVALQMNIRGTILVYVVIMNDGSLHDLKIIRGLEPALDAEVIRVVKLMPLWRPAMQKGVAVNVRCTLPITVSSGKAKL